MNALKKGWVIGVAIIIGLLAVASIFREPIYLVTHVPKVCFEGYCK